MIIIPGEIISLAMFPGVVLHEIAHRFFCDINDIPVYGVSYFVPFSKTAGCVIHERTNNVSHAFLISAGPLIINSLICILLTMPYAITVILGTDFVSSDSIFNGFAKNIMLWIGYSAGLFAFPSRQDVNDLSELGNSDIAKLFILIFVGIIEIVNIKYISFFFRIGYCYILSGVLPWLIF